MTVIRFEAVSKWYPRYGHFLQGLKASLLNWRDTVHSFHQPRFQALDSISFAIERGEAVGILGDNGSGKSTTLALIAGVLEPQQGVVVVQGRVCPLLALGAGFHYDLSGRENIILNGVLLGLTRREIMQRMDQIIAFSELEPFLEEPIRTYSSGMVARLGFSIAAHLDPDILLIDEILSVGDIGFQAKCFEAMKTFKAKGTTIVLVSHSLMDVRRLCDRAMWLEHGKLIEQGPADRIVSRYEKKQEHGSGVADGADCPVAMSG